MGRPIGRLGDILRHGTAEVSVGLNVLMIVLQGDAESIGSLELRLHRHCHVCLPAPPRPGASQATGSWREQLGLKTEP